jgi:SAM-dependent methyltransferase
VENPVLEVGCGPGQVGAYLQERGRQVVGTDLSPGMARLAARRLASAAVADLRSLPIRRASVGSVLAFYSIIHIPRPQLAGALSELRRVLRPGGRLLLSAHEGDRELAVDEFLGETVPFVATFFSLDELVVAIRSAGMEVTLAERRPPYEAEHSTVPVYVEARCPPMGS